MTEPIWSAGGVGGVRAVLDDLETAAGALGEAAGELDDAARALAVAAQVATWTPARAPAAAGLGEAAAASSAEAARLRDLAHTLRATALAYLEAEDGARRAVSLAGRLGEAAADWFGSVAWLHRTAAVATGGAGAARMLGVPGLPPTTGMVGRDEASGLLALAGEDYARIVAGLALAVRRAEAGEPAYRAVEAAPVLADEAPGGLEDLVGRLAWVHVQGGGTLAIETVRDHAGVRHLVYVPGTEDWGVTSGNPADLEADLVSVLGATSDAARAVVDAVAAHGIGPDEPILLAGHSQGGMVAMIAAAALADRFRVERVVTAGAPTGRIRLPPTVAALHLENTRDLVPGLDGRANPETARRVTVSHDRRRSHRADAPDGSRTVAEAHGFAGYAATARLVDEGVSDSTRAWLADARPLLTEAPSTVTAYRPVTG
ncbi:hypothetical protein QQX09_04660 [Demequina sp. SYSU T00192]|uniref:PGAP1-like protein n=1 Tax=Demequina litoralis TaxID=3051660 RepID=A0ABT8G889_9MICO|nr:hypothetical protein [Demequina sp. SYSU T00192]MDN4475149.1 hypothetical protein [Demequina sp. SYSU T00192]